MDFREVGGDSDSGYTTALQSEPKKGRAGGEFLPRVLMVGSSGGHLAQMLSLRPWWSGLERHWVTFRTPDAVSQLGSENVTWGHYPTTRNIPNLLRNTWLAWRVLRRQRPDVVVSTGAGICLPFFVLARLLKVRTVYIEVYDRLDSRTLTARLCRPFAHLFCVQWEEQRRQYPHSILIGQLL